MSEVVLGIYLQGSFEVLYCLVEFQLLLKRKTYTIICCIIFWIKFDSLTESLLGLSILIQEVISIAQTIICCIIIWIKFDGLTVSLLGLSILLLLVISNPYTIICCMIIGVQLYSLLVALDGLAVVLLLGVASGLFEVLLIAHQR